jgi:hypothetical protein
MCKELRERAAGLEPASGGSAKSTISGRLFGFSRGELEARAAAGAHPQAMTVRDVTQRAAAWGPLLGGACGVMPRHRPSRNPAMSKQASSTVLILGANGRLGLATAQAFAAAGWQVLAQVRREAAPGMPASARLLRTPVHETARLAREGELPSPPLEAALLETVKSVAAQASAMPAAARAGT